MTNQQHTITPSPEQIYLWQNDWKLSSYEPGITETIYVATQAARWGADTELDACCRWLTQEFPRETVVIRQLRTARRPKPEGPTDEELRELWNDGWDTSEEHGAFKFARAVLARWGRPAPQPVDGEVAELVAWLRKTSSAAFMDGWPNEESINIGRAADLLERLSPPQPVPPSLKEQALEMLECIPTYDSGGRPNGIDVSIIRRALEQLDD